MKRLSAVPLLVILSGCATGPRLVPPTNGLDRAIRYKEVSSSGAGFDLSGETTSITGVPADAKVDLNSTIQIQIQKDAVQAPSGIIPESEKTTFLARTKELQDALALLSQVVTARKTTLDAYSKEIELPVEKRRGSTEDKAFRAARSVSGDLESRFTDLPLWTSGTTGATEGQVSDLFKDGTYQAVGTFLQQRLDAVQWDYQQAESKANAQAAKLTIYAFLEPQKGDSLAMHLPEYDDLDAREATFKSSHVLDKDDLAAFRQEWDQTVALAKQAEQVRAGETSLNAALIANGQNRLAKLIDEAQRAERFLAQDWPSTLDQLNAEFELAAQTARDVAGSDAKSQIAAYETQLHNAQKELTTSPPVADLRNLISHVKTLRTEWQNVTAATLTTAIDHSVTVRDESLKVSNEMRNLDSLKASLENVFEPAKITAAGFPARVADDLRAKLAEPAVLPKTKSLILQAQEVHTFIADAASFLQFDTKPSLAEPKLPNLKAFTWDEAPNTRVELQRTPRSIDDRVHVISTLSQGDTVSMKSHAIFDVDQFGYHSSLSPSVILARPIRTHGLPDEDFKFAPAVSWLHTWHPRPTDSDPFAHFFRFTQMSFGLHAAFLEQNSSKPSEIGLGGAVSVWSDRIVAGAGWNLMNNSKAYFYIGSNLIPILQALGYGKAGAAGKQP